jgi:hypothetical protein
MKNNISSTLTLHYSKDLLPQKIILKGSDGDIYAFQELNPDFDKYFKVQADFEESAPISLNLLRTIASYLNFEHRQSSTIPIERR